MSDALRELLREKLEGFHDAERFVVAYSGGADSHALLHAVVALNLPQDILALHVNHGLSPNADAWQAHLDAFKGTGKNDLFHFSLTERWTPQPLFARREGYFLWAK